MTDDQERENRKAMNAEVFDVPATVQVSVLQIAYAVCDALEGGACYWCVDFEPDRYVEGYAWGHEQVALGVPFTIRTEEDEDEPYHVPNDKAWLGHALGAMAAEYPKHFMDLATDRGDAITGDVLFQIICFGEVVYG